MDYKKPIAHLLHASPLSLGEISARVCYDSFSLSEHSDINTFPQTLALPSTDINSSEVLHKLVWTHFHESIIEHINLSYFIEDISREVIIELNRHRIGIATSQQSTRYTMEDVVNAWIDYRDAHNPAMMKSTWDVFERVVATNIIDLNPNMIEITAKYISNKLFVYNGEELLVRDLTGSKKKHQNDRVKRCLPEVFTLQGTWTFNLRALKHFHKLRSSGSAYYGIQELWQAIEAVTPQKYLDLIIKN